jgi:hypothetical protein
MIPTRTEDLILRSRAKRGVSKDGREHSTSWFETRRFAARLTLRALA